MHLHLLQHLLGAVSGLFVGLSLGLFGGGGSILAVPLLVYVVGVADMHVAIGTSAVAVSANALVNLVIHARRRNVLWRCALIYTAAGVMGAFFGSLVGKAMDGDKLLFLFALLMSAVGALMFRGRRHEGTPGVSCTSEKIPKVLGFGGATGALSGFFGIGGGFLIVPALVASTGMPVLNAVGSSLVAVAAFGLTTALSYAFSGLVDWPLVALFVAGGILGGMVGARAAAFLSTRKGVLNMAFAGLILLVSIYMAARTASSIF